MRQTCGSRVTGSSAFSCAANIEDTTYVADNPRMQTVATDRTTGSGERPLHPYPDGWYVLELGSSLRREQLIEKTWMGREIVIWRDHAGAVCVADAFCPHLGSHLGPSVGGMVRDGKLVCPFHGFQYDVSGKCVAARDAPPPRSARLKLYEVAEVNGFIFAYWDNAGRPAEWQIPDVCPDGWEGRVVQAASAQGPSADNDRKLGRSLPPRARARLS